MLSDEALREYYERGFAGDNQLKGQCVNARVNLAALRELVNLSSVRTFLDVGAGYGFLVDAIKRELGVDARGVDLSEQEATYARERLGVDVRSGVLTSVGFEPASFDVVAAFEVIEHLLDPAAFVQELASYVRPGGTLVVMTDNFEAAVVRRMAAEWPKWIPHAHVSHFSGASLERTISGVPGLRLERRLSFTPWENQVRAIPTLFRAPLAPDASFNLDRVLASEMHGRYRLFDLKHRLNRLWFRLTARRNLEGSLMYVTARKDAMCLP